MKRINEIDLLRFLAALSVVFYHYCFRGYAADNMTAMPLTQFAPVSKYGYLGVDLFFIISGFVILMSASSGSARRFIVSRIVRLYPAFWACCTLTFLFTLIIGGNRYEASLTQYLLNLPMISEFIGVESIDGVYWSLFVEIKFYLLIVLALLLRQINQAPLLLVLWLLTTIALEVFPIGKLESLLITAYSPYFIAGACYYLIWSKGPSILKSLIISACWVLAVIKGVNRLNGMEDYYHTTFNPIVVATLISLFFIVFLLISFRKSGWFAKRNWVFLGSLTYPLYLMHQHVGFMIFNTMYPHVNSTLLLFLTLVFIILLSYLVHKYIEQKYSSSFKSIITNMLNTLVSKTSVCV